MKILLQRQEGQQQGIRFLHASKEPAVVSVCRRVRMLLAAVGSEGRARSSVHDRSSSREETIRRESVHRQAASPKEVDAAVTGIHQLKIFPRFKRKLAAT